MSMYNVGNVSIALLFAAKKVQPLYWICCDIDSSLVYIAGMQRADKCTVLPSNSIAKVPYP